MRYSPVSGLTMERSNSTVLMAIFFLLESSCRNCCSKRAAPAFKARFAGVRRRLRRRSKRAAPAFLGSDAVFDGHVWKGTPRSGLERRAKRVLERERSELGTASGASLRTGNQKFCALSIVEVPRARTTLDEVEKATSRRLTIVCMVHSGLQRVRGLHPAVVGGEVGRELALGDPHRADEEGLRGGPVRRPLHDLREPAGGVVQFDGAGGHRVHLVDALRLEGRGSSRSGCFRSWLGSMPPPAALEAGFARVRGPLCGHSKPPSAAFRLIVGAGRGLKFRVERRGAALNGERSEPSNAAQPLRTRAKRALN